MEYELLSSNITVLAKELAILKDYISLKFGMDFEHFKENRAKGIRVTGTSGFVDSSVQNAQKRKVLSSTSSSAAATNARKRKKQKIWSRPAVATVSRPKRDSTKRVTYTNDEEDQSEEEEEEMEVQYVPKTECDDDNDPDYDAFPQVDYGSDTNFGTEGSEIEGQELSILPHVSGDTTTPTLTAETANRAAELRDQLLGNKGNSIKKRRLKEEIKTTTEGLHVFPSIRGGKFYATYTGHQYNHRSTSTALKFQSFRCLLYNKTLCPGKLQLSEDFTTVLTVVKEHSHPPDPTKAMRSYLQWQLKTRGRDCNESTGSFIKAQLINLPDELLGTLPKLETLQRSVLRFKKRSKVDPDSGTDAPVNPEENAGQETPQWQGVSH